ncbi:MAG: hypothetical protein HGA53_04830, partial [Anaerolineaceae bacterium]|nr:hypothetical protein [Anaerolineaceae bacterium]
MENILQQVITLLTTPPGNLVYHITLLVCIVTAWQSLVVNKLFITPEKYTRTTMAIGVLLLSQVGLFILSGLSWQGIGTPKTLLPPVDRLVLFLSIIWVAWAWSFPSKKIIPDSIFILLNLSGFLFFGYTLNGWVASSIDQISFNTISTSQIWLIVIAAAAFIGFALMLILRPKNWGAGSAFFLIQL